VSVEKHHIGARSIIGAGGVVVKDIPENVTAVGIPAKPMRI
jgi:serine acetyltransferase